MRQKRRRSVIAALTLVLLSPARSALADDCFTASDEARSLLSQKHLQAARAQLRLCAAAACEEAVRGVCEERLLEVSARLPTIIFDVKDHAGHDLVDVTLAIDGGAAERDRIGTEITLDPGPHTFVFAGTNAPPLETRFLLVEREKGRREHLVLGSPPPPPLPPPVDPAPAQPTGESPWRSVSWIAIGAGAVGLGIGTAFGVDAIVKNEAAGCDAANICDDPRSRSDARSAATISTIGITAGALLVATGVALYFLTPATPKRAAFHPWSVRW